MSSGRGKRMLKMLDVAVGVRAMRLEHQLTEMRERGEDRPAFGEQVLSCPEFVAAIERAWPSE